MFDDLKDRPNYALFKRKGPVPDNDLPVFLIDDDWEEASNLAETEGVLGYDHDRIKKFLSKTLRPGSVTMRAPWAFCTHPRISKVYVGPFLTVDQNWVAGILKERPSEHRGLFFVDHQNRQAHDDLNAAYDTIKLLIDADVSPSRIFSFTISAYRDVSKRIDSEFGVRKNQLLVKANLDDRPVEEMEKIIQATDANLNYVPFLTVLKRVPAKGPLKESTQVQALTQLAATDPNGPFAWASEHATKPDFHLYYSALRAFARVSHQPTSPLGENPALVCLAAVARRRAGLVVNDECQREERQFWEHAKGHYFRGDTRRPLLEIFGSISSALAKAHGALASVHISGSASEPRLVLEFDGTNIAGVDPLLRELETICGGLTRGPAPNLALITFVGVDDLSRERMRRSTT